MSERETEVNFALNLIKSICVEYKITLTNEHRCRIVIVDDVTGEKYGLSHGGVKND